ncbi:MAG TPA: hypothetical protein VFS43_01770 [Polyangiaceae bacterium]|nr:hypothetical protein [Polyangiaceae bacterium]
MRDDVGVPLAGAAVIISARGAGDEPLRLGPPSACDVAPAGAPRASGDGVAVETDRAGGFCVRVQPDRLPSGAVLRLEHRGGEGLDAARREVAVDGLLGAPILSWDPRPDVLDLDAPRLHVNVVASAPGAEAEAAPAAGVALVLEDEGGRRLGTARSDGAGRALFDLASSELGPPGAGELVVRPVAGAGAHEPLRTPVLRYARVSLVVAQPPGPVVPHDGHVFDAAVETSRGPARSGAVEARVGGEPVGAAGVREGRARVPVAFDVPAAATLPITFQYLPDDPALRAGEPATLQVPVRPPSLWRRAPLLALVALLALWTARGWRRAPAPARPEPRPASAPLPVGREGVIEGPSAGGEGWRGQVVDAHGAEAVAGARVAVVRRTFQGERVVAEAVTDAQGMFALDAPFESHATLVVEGPLHRRLERPAPKPGHVIVALVARRRALLDALVRSARRAGGPWKSDPTPAQVALAAQAAGQAPTEAWARAVEGAAFGPEPVDAAAEAQIAALAPEQPPSIGPPLRPH